MLLCYYSDQIPDDWQGVELVQGLPLGHGVGVQVLMGDDPGQAKGLVLVTEVRGSIRR